jgi:carboxymethylenebutenolidase
MSAVKEVEIEIPLCSGETLPSLLVGPDGDAQRPAILVAGDIGGARRPFIDLIARQLAGQGYDAIVPEFFFRQGPLSEFTQDAIRARRAKLDDVQTLSDLEAATDWLQRRPVMAGVTVGAIGFCLGGTFVLNLSARRSDLATVAYYGFPGPTPARAGVQGPYPLDETEGLHGPVLAFWGDQDQRAGQEHIRRYVDSFAQRDVDFTAVIYPGLGHNFLAMSWEPDATGHDLAMDSWRQALAFFSSHLGAL